jgi:hypothetical protein
MNKCSSLYYGARCPGSFFGAMFSTLISLRGMSDEEAGAQAGGREPPESPSAVRNNIPRLLAI